MNGKHRIGRIVAAGAILAAVAAAAQDGAAARPQSARHLEARCPHNHCLRLWYKLTVRHDYNFKVSFHWLWNDTNDSGYSNLHSDWTANTTWRAESDTPVLVRTAPTLERPHREGFAILHGKLLVNLEHSVWTQKARWDGYSPNAPDGAISWDCSQSALQTSSTTTFEWSGFRLSAGTYGPDYLVSYEGLRSEGTGPSTYDVKRMECPVCVSPAAIVEPLPKQQGQPCVYPADHLGGDRRYLIDGLWDTHRIEWDNGIQNGGEWTNRYDVVGRVGDPDITVRQEIDVSPREFKNQNGFYQSIEGHWGIEFNLALCPGGGRTSHGC